MFCKKCGTQMADGASFCPSCGAANEAAANASAENLSAVSSSTYTVESVSNPSFLKKYWGALVAGAAVVAVAIAVPVYLNNAKKGPIAAFAVASDNLMSDTKKVESCKLTFEADGYEGEFLMEVNPKDQVMYLYGEFDLDYYEMEMAMLVEGEEGCIVVGYDGEYESEDLDEYMDPAEIWESYDKDPEDMDWQEMIEDADLDSELEDYVDIDRINEVVDNVVKAFKDGGNRARIEEAMQLTSTKADGVTTYSAVITADSLLNTATALIEICEEACGDAVESDVFDDAKDGLEEAREEAEDDDFLEEEMFEVSYGIKNDRFTNISFVSGEYLEDEGEGEFEISLDFDYDGKALNGFEMTMDMDMGYDSVSASIAMIEINAVEGVKDEIPDDILELAGMDE